MWSEFIGDLVILFSAIFAVLGKDALSPGLVGLSLSFALQVIIMSENVIDSSRIKSLAIFVLRQSTSVFLS